MLVQLDEDARERPAVWAGECARDAKILIDRLHEVIVETDRQRMFQAIYRLLCYPLEWEQIHAYRGLMNPRSLERGILSADKSEEVGNGFSGQERELLEAMRGTTMKALPSPGGR